MNAATVRTSNATITDPYYCKVIARLPAFQNQRVRTRTGRSGLSLLEVVLAIAILGTALAAISQLIMIGYRSAMEARERTEAALICDSIMAEVAAGAIELESNSGQAVPGTDDWTFAISIEESQQLGLLVVTVTVTQSGPNVVDPISMSVVRYMPDPDYDPTEVTQ